MEYGSHPSVRGHADDIVKKVVTNMIMGRALVFNAYFINEIQGIRLSLLGVV